MIYVTGDIHGELGIRRLGSRYWPLGKTLSKEDILLIAGDFGLVFYGKNNALEQYWLDWLEERPWTTVFIDGNHENFPELWSYPEKELFGGKVGILRPSVIHLKQRGHIYTIGGKRVWCCGGAYSIDKEDRVLGKSWWAEEEASYVEMNAALGKLPEHVDFVLTHEAPFSVIQHIYKGKTIQDSRTARFLDTVANLIDTNLWFFGHHHLDEDYFIYGFRKYIALYTRILEIS